MPIPALPLFKHRDTVVTPADQNQFVTQFENTMDTMSNDVIPALNLSINDMNTQYNNIYNNLPFAPNSGYSQAFIDNNFVKLRNTNITVNVGVGQTYTTINQALEYLSGFYPMYKKSGVTATINLKAGFVMAEQVLVSGIDLGWITIVGENAETIITHTALTINFYGSYPAFGVDKGGTSPIIGQLFRFNVEKVGGNKYGLMAGGAGSSADVSSGKGFIGAGTYGIFASAGSTINAQGANCSNAGTSGISASAGSTINAQGANCSNAGTYGISADFGSTINASSANCSNAGTSGISASAGSMINATSAIIQNQTTGSSRLSVAFGSTIAARSINTTGGTAPVFSQAVNTVTIQGVIYG